MQNRILVVLLVCALALAGCAGSIGRKGVQASIGPASADATGAAKSEIDADVVVSVFTLLANVVVVVLRAGLPGALGSAVLPVPLAPAATSTANDDVAPHVHLTDEDAPRGAVVVVAPGN